MWSPWARATPVVDLGLKVATMVSSNLSQTFEGDGLRVIYLAERVCCQLAIEDVPRVPIDPLVFMLAPHSTMNAEYELWRPGIPFIDQVIDELDYDKFSRTHLMPSFIVSVCVLTLLIFFNQSYHLHSYTLVTFKWNIYVRRALLPMLLLIPPRLPWSVYAYGPDGFAWERPIGRNTNMATPFLKAPRQWVIFHPYSLSFLLLLPNTCSNILSFKIQPTVYEHKELIWLAGNLKLELTKYSR